MKWTVASLEKLGLCNSWRQFFWNTLQCYLGKWKSQPVLKDKCKFLQKTHDPAPVFVQDKPVFPREVEIAGTAASVLETSASF